MAVAGGILLVLFTLVMAVIGIAAYLVVSFSIYTMAKNRGLANPWLAFVPIANLYILAQLIRTLNIFGFEIPMFTVVYPLAAVVVGLLGQVDVIGTILSLAYFILSIAALNKLYRMYAPDNATLYTVLSIFGIPAIIILFMIRNNTPVEAA
jgi:hypothetical protein